MSGRAERLLLALASAALLAGCADRTRERPEEAARPTERSADSAAAVSPADSIATEKPPAISYRAQKIEAGQRTIRALRDELGEDGFLLFLRVNRVDLRHVRAGATLAVPAVPLVADSAWSAYSPFPIALPAAGEHPKLLLVSLRVQAVAAYEGGRLVHWAPASTGRKASPTPPGLYHTNWKSRRRNSTIDEEWILEWAFNIENRLGISLHKYDLPGHPASHSCVRLLEEDAKWIYDWADQFVVSPDGRTVVRNGTPVVIFGEYDWEGTPPWHRLTEDPRAASVSAEEIDAALRQYAPGSAESAAASAAGGVADSAAAIPPANPGE